MRTFAYGWEGVSGIEAGLRESVELGKPVSFEIAESEDGLAPFEVVSVGLGRGSSGVQWRFCGEGNNPSGAGSHMLCSSPDPASAAVELAFRLGQSIGRLKHARHMAGLSNRIHVFRQPTDEEENAQ
jgi:hypothetical protein